MNKKNRTLVAILLILTIGLIGLTIAYFSNSTSIENEFNTKEYGTTYTEEFLSPDNWLPGDTTDKIVTVINSGQVDEAVRISYNEKWVAKDGTILSGLIDENGNLTDEEENSERAAIINFSNNGDWTYDNGYYYYNYRLSPNEITSSLIDSVTFNRKVKSSSNCTTTENNGVKSITCNSSNSGYDGATYTLTLKIETVQYNKYKEAWGVDVTTFSMNPMTTREFISKANPVSITNYTDGDIHEMYTFEHEATEQTPALTDYRYIGDDPYNYVYFNCDSLDNQNSETCEVWRIIGVFDVEDEDGNWEKSFKLVRSRSLPDFLMWDSYNRDDWTRASSKNSLNLDFYYSLNFETENMIRNSIFYLGSLSWNLDFNGFGNAEQIYNFERGNSLCYSCENDLKKLKWDGKIGLMYASDLFLTYSLNVEDNCYSNPFICSMYSNHFPNKSWIYNSNIIDGKSNITWWTRLITPSSETGPSKSLIACNNGSLGRSSVNADSGTEQGMRPVLYLKSNVKLIDGNGSESNPYQLGYIQEYPEYTKGQIVTYDNQEYYVMTNSSDNKSFVKLLKKEPLTSNEINSYNTNYTSTNGEYPYLETNTCTSGNTSNCSNNYDTSSIKTIIDNWSSNYANDLVEIDGYKARLINYKEIVNNLAYEYKVLDTYSGFISSGDTPNWAYINGKSYWSMFNVEDSNTQVYGVSYSLSEENIYNKRFIRPVIYLKKCAITNTCE